MKKDENLNLTIYSTEYTFCRRTETERDRERRRPEISSLTEGYRLLLMLQSPRKKISGTTTKLFNQGKIKRVLTYGIWAYREETSTSTHSIT